MRKIIIIGIGYFIIIQSFAQVSIGGMLGANISNFNYNYEISGFEPDTKAKLGIQLGIIGEYNISDQFVFQSGLTYQSLGYNFDLEAFSGGNTKGFARYKTNEIRIPLNINYQYENLRVFFGTYAGVIFSAKAKWDFDQNGVNDKGETNYDIGNNINEDDIRPLDLGITFGAGYTYDQLLFQLSYSMGLSNLQPEDPDGSFDASENSFKSNNISLGVTYFFNK